MCICACCKSVLYTFDTVHIHACALYLRAIILHVGVVGQSNPSGAPAASSHVELPSPHPASGVLVRPIPQQPSPVRVSSLHEDPGGWPVLIPAARPRTFYVINMHL